MRRLFVLAVLLLVPAPATSLANGCPAPCSGQVSSLDGLQLLYVQPAGVGGAVHAYDPDSTRGCSHCRPESAPPTASRT